MAALRSCALIGLMLALSAVHTQAAAPGSTDYPIKTVVVLMLENRAFDHMCGYLNRLNPEIHGLVGNESNPMNVSDPNSPRVKVNPDAPYVDPDPSHSVPSTTEQIFGGRADHSKAYMDGFVQNAIKEGVKPPEAVMASFNHTSVPVISTLAMEYAIFDHWHASVPGPTEVNRMYFFSATSDGAAYNDVDKIIEGYPQKPLFVSVAEAGHSWGVYYEDISTALTLSQMRSIENLEKFKTMDSFIEDAKNGNLPEFTFLDPNYYPFLWAAANDQHPSHSVAEGEALIKKVYEAVRASPQWNETLFVLTYDEHGGFHDSVPTPLKVPNPDGKVSTNPPFDFTRLGVRIPTIMASPWINKGTVVHEGVGPTSSSHYEHSSMAATLKKMWGMPNFLTKRDAWASTFEHVFMQRSTPRTDCPMKLPDAPKLSKAQVEREGYAPMTDLQREFVTLADSLHKEDVMDKEPVTQYEGALYVRRKMTRFLQNNGHKGPFPLH